MVLGASSAAPAHGRNQTAQLLSIHSRWYLIDCGEGTQHQFFRYHLRPHKLGHIFISHLHGDHYLGLVGLLSTLHLQKREHPIHIFGPAGLQEIITVNLKHSGTVLNYPLHFTVVPPDRPTLLLDDKNLTVESIPLSHRVPCTGFLFREKPKPYRINKATMPPDMRLQDIALLKQGLDVVNEAGELVYPVADYTLPPRHSRSYAYCSDTRYLEAIVPQIEGVDLLYHEATFMHDLLDRAEHTFHSTTIEAATIAKMAQVRQLMIGHYSIRYRDLQPMLDEARTVFPETILAEEGETVNLPDA